MKPGTVGGFPPPSKGGSPLRFAGDSTGTSGEIKCAEVVQTTQRMKCSKTLAVQSFRSILQATANGEKHPGTLFHGDNIDQELGHLAAEIWSETGICFGSLHHAVAPCERVHISESLCWMRPPR
jgi:hypothetical protein